MVICGVSEFYLKGKEREPHNLIYTRVFINKNHMYFYVRIINTDSITMISPLPTPLMLDTELRASHILGKLLPLS